jgi:hypothetical protein
MQDAQITAGSASPLIVSRVAPIAASTVRVAKAGRPQRKQFGVISSLATLVAAIRAARPELRREAKRCINDFPPDLTRYILDTADKLGVSVDSVLLYGLILRLSGEGRDEALRSLRRYPPLANVSENELDAAIAEARRRLDAEMTRNRRRMGS